MEEKVVTSLALCPLFAGLQREEISLLMASVDHWLVGYEGHDVYALAGMPCRYADIIVAGVLVCRMSSLSGKQIEVSRLRAGNLVAPAFLFAKDNLMPVSVETESSVTVLRMRPETLKRLIDEDERIRMNYIRVLCNIDVFLTHKMKVLSLYTVREKVAYLLLEQAGEQDSDRVHLHRSRQEIADSFGIRKFSLLRVLSDFQEQGAIRIDGREIEILDRSKLK